MIDDTPNPQDLGIIWEVCLRHGQRTRKPLCFLLHGGKPSDQAKFLYLLQARVESLSLVGILLESVRPMTSEEVIDKFLSFFHHRDHLLIPDASLVPQDDQTLLFINSRMAPLKPYFLGKKQPPHRNLCDIQGCVRTVDIELVGDRQHLTLFEMLGSWSIGEYWKDRTIEPVYDLLVNEFGYDPTRLYATVYSGNADLNIPPDDERHRPRP